MRYFVSTLCVIAFLHITAHAQCNFNAPLVFGEEKCEGSILQPLIATKPITTTENVDEWRWYTISSGGTPIFTSTSSSSFAHGVSNTTPSSTTFFVSYVATETISGQQCESPRTPVTVVVNPIPVPPTVTSGNPKSLVVQVSDTFLAGENTSLSATGQQTIEWMNPSCSTVQATGSTFATGLTPFDLGSHTYKVRQRDAVSGCASVCVDAQIHISKCPALTPSAIDAFYCVGEATPLTVTAVANGTQAAGDKLTWFATSNIAGTPILDNSATYSEALNTAAPFTKTVYVAQYNAASVCYSQPKAVTINVVANPFVSLTAPANVCATAGLVNITTTPVGGVLTGTGATGLNAAARTWDPMNGGVPNPSKILNLTYVVNETHPDGKVCSTTKTASTTAHFMAPPVPENKTWLINDIANIPSNFMTASPSGTGASIQWYRDQGMTNPLANAPFSTVTHVADITALQAEIGLPQPMSYSKSYWITQTDTQGCESESVKVELVLTSSMYPAPSASNIVACVGTVLNPITAIVPAGMSESVDEWRWYTSQNTTTPIYTGASTFVHGVNNMIAGTTIFYVSYVVTESISGIQYESQRAWVTVVVNEVPNVTASSNSPVCEGASLQLSVTNISGALYSWTGPTYTSIVQNSLRQNATVEMSGTYTVAVNVNGCVKTSSVAVTVATSPPAPIVQNVTYCEGSQPGPIVVQPIAGAFVKYYTSATGGTGSTMPPTPPTSAVGTYSFWVSQTLNGCESPRERIIVTIVSLPVVEVTASLTTLCADQESELGIRVISGGPIVNSLWSGPLINQSSTNPIIYQNLMSLGSYNYSVQVTNAEGCSNTASKTITVLNSIAPPAPEVDDFVGITGLGEPVVLLAKGIVSGATVRWYSENDILLTNATNPFSTADNPVVEMVKIYKASQVLNGCESSKTSALVTITDCPHEAPIAIGQEICIGTQFSPISADKPQSTHTSVEEWKWYTSPTGSTPIYTSNSSNIYSHELSNTVPGTTTFYVSYVATDIISGKQCESLRTSIALIVYDTPKPLQNQNFVIHHNQENTVTIPDYDTSCEYTWYSDAELQTIVNTGESYTFTSDVDTKTMYLTQSKHTCESEPAQYKLCAITKPIVSQESIEIISNELMPEIVSTAVLQNNEYVVWIESDNGYEHIANSYTPRYFIPNTYNLTSFITNTVTGCASQLLSIPVTILPCGNKPTPLTDTVIQVFYKQAIPTLQTVESNVVWYDARYTQIAEGATYIPRISNPGTYVFYAQQKDALCSSALQKFTITIESFAIRGTVFFDRNEDGIQQSNDSPVENQMLYVVEADTYISTNSKGEFVWNTNEYGTYTIQLVQKLSENDVLNSQTQSATIDEQHAVVQHVNFRYKVNTTHNLLTDISYSSRPVVGRDFKIYCYNKNLGITQYNVLTRITYDNTKCTLKSTTKPFHTHVGNEIEVIYDSIRANSSSYFVLTFTVLPDFTLTDQIIAIYSSIQSAQIDYNPNDNVDSLKLVITNSQDPNDKAVTPSYKENGYVLMNSTLQYKIRFQNKGTADAWDINIKDTIDENLDLSTFKILATSHDMHYTIAGRVITFYFDSIMLPAEMYDEPGSNGFIDYEISPLPNVPEETQVFNTAHIFFDFNPAVVTNTTKSTYVIALPKDDDLPDAIEQISSEFSIAPNPVYSKTLLTFDAQGPKQLTLQSITGKILLQTSFYTTTYLLDCSNLEPGVYVCTIVHNGKSIKEKIVVK